MSVFCPDGYVPARAAMVRAAEYWCPEQFAALEGAAAPQSETKPDNSVDAAVRAFSRPQIPDAWRHAREEIASQTAHRLRNLLHQDTLKAYYFDDNGCHSIACSFWVTPAADGTLESGTFWPFGRPDAWYERRPSYPLFLVQSELDTLLRKQETKRPFPRARKSELVDGLRRLDHLSRRAQFRELRAMFHEFTITEALWREAVKKVGARRPGRKSRR